MGRCEGAGTWLRHRDIWAKHPDAIRLCSALVLTDLSEGMLEAARDCVGEYDNVSYEQADTQSIPFEQDSFDAVIANMMLYHVPDLRRALLEVRRVLKPGGSFYCATFGEHGILIARQLPKK